MRGGVRQGADPAELYAGASLETAMHAALAHDVVVHVYCVDNISSALRDDALMQLERRLDRLR